MFTRPDDYIAPGALTQLFSEDDIASRLQHMADDIYQLLGPDIIVVGLLKGSFVFMADLVRALHHAGCCPRVDFLTISSYGDGKESSGSLNLLSNIADDVAGHHVLLVDDILESGRTISFARSNIQQQGAASVTLCVLLDKPGKRVVPCEADIVGFRIEDQFVVGYGLDYAGYYRELPFIGVL